MSSGQSVVGVDPAGAEALARELVDAMRALEGAAGEVRQALADAGVASFAPADLEQVAVWCAEQAAEVRRRARAAEGPGVNAGAGAGAAASLFDLGPSVEQLRRDQLFALLDVGEPRPEMERWLIAEFPDVAERRNRARRAMKPLHRARTQHVVKAYMSGPGRGRGGEQLAQLQRLQGGHAQRSRATAAEMERFIADLDGAQVRHLAAALVRVLAKRDGQDGNGDLAEALAPLRARLRDQLGHAARQAYMGVPGRAAVDAEAIAKLYKDLGFEPKRRSPSALAGFLGGFFLGDLARNHDGRGNSQLSRTLGQTLSGLFAVGDVRDALANLHAARWREAAHSAFGAIPLAGDAAKATEAAADVVGVTRRTRRIWSPRPEAVVETKYHPRIGKLYRMQNGNWWAKDLAGHGGSAWKVFVKQGDRLKWVKDADEFGTFLDHKHKSPTGIFIPLTELSGR